MKNKSDFHPSSSFKHKSGLLKRLRKSTTKIIKKNDQYYRSNFLRELRLRFMLVKAQCHNIRRLAVINRFNFRAYLFKREKPNLFNLKTELVVIG